MSAKAKVALFVVVFCIIAIVPFAANGAASAQDPEVSLDTPTINALPEKRCIESTEYMRANHMVMLEQWRDDVVRDGDLVYTNSFGQDYEKSLHETCFSCHSNPDEFCTACHTYSGVTLYCGDCHNMTDAGLQGK